MNSIASIERKLVNKTEGALLLTTDNELRKSKDVRVEFFNV